MRCSAADDALRQISIWPRLSPRALHLGEALA
jgi:hypothetical protein